MFVSHKYSLSEEACVFSGNRVVQDFGDLNKVVSTTLNNQQSQQIKRKRNLPGNPDPDAEVIALSPKTLLTTNRFICEVCKKGFQRDQNLQLHRRGHNLPWKLKQRNSNDVHKKVYVCPEPSCVHHHPSRALGDLTGIKKHYCRKHGEKKWKCNKCSKIYAVQSDWKAHSKICGTREYKCDCGTLFSRKDSFVTHRAFCVALAEESARLLSSSNNNIFLSPTPNPNPNPNLNPLYDQIIKMEEPYNSHNNNMIIPTSLMMTSPLQELCYSVPPATSSSLPPSLSATALLQKAMVKEYPPGVDPALLTQLPSAPEHGNNIGGFGATWRNADGLTRDFLGINGSAADAVNISMNERDVLKHTEGGVERSLSYETAHPTSFVRPPQGFGFPARAAWNGY